MMSKGLKRPYHALYVIAVFGILPSFGFTAKTPIGVLKTIGQAQCDFALQVASVSDETSAELSGNAEREPISYLDDGFVFGLADSGLDRPKGKRGERNHPTEVT